MESEKTAQTGEETGQQAKPQETEDTRDYKKLYQAEVDNAKNQRGRAQKAEDKLSGMEKATEEARKKKLAENGKYEELIAEMKTENDALRKKSEYWDEYETREKTELLEKLPEEDREDFSNLSLGQIKKVVGRLTQTKPEALKEVHGAVKPAIKPVGDWTEMSAEEQREQWPNIMQEAREAGNTN